ncbi:MAG: sigma factor-like helix-turn-helix DNA-binding protein [Terriglobales bacterium]|jgi:transposase
MIEADKRKAIFLLHQEGMPLREIARRLHVSRNTVGVVIAQGGQLPKLVRSPKQKIDSQLLQGLYDQCGGWIQRMHEKLTEEQGIEVKYSTLTRMLRQSGISKSRQSRCSQVPDEPGAEMQHDTTVYRLKLGEQLHRVVASILYLRYSKRRYLKFYRCFNRFQMKCFLHEALIYWGYVPRQCIIDNTNLARLRGTGAQAVIVPEMEAFARQYGFQFRCHEKGHCDRKAGEERSFWTVETNFLAGRSFLNFNDLNRQAFQWATVRMEHRPQGKAKLIPAKAFEHERRYLSQLPAHLPAPYQVHERGTDQYGYAAFEGNYYWVPGLSRQEVKILQYSDRLKIYLARECLAEYPLPADGVTNQRFSPPQGPTPPSQPNNRRYPSTEEEKRLRALDPEVSRYLDFVLQSKTVQRHLFLRRLLALSHRMTPELFVKSVQRAHRYRITSLQTIERIALLHLAEGTAELPFAELDEGFRQRSAYQEGSLTDPPDLSIYQDQPEQNHE